MSQGFACRPDAVGEGTDMLRSLACATYMLRSTARLLPAFHSKLYIQNDTPEIFERETTRKDRKKAGGNDFTEQINAPAKKKGLMSAHSWLLGSRLGPGVSAPSDPDPYRHLVANELVPQEYLGFEARLRFLRRSKAHLQGGILSDRGAGSSYDLGGGAQGMS